MTIQRLNTKTTVAAKTVKAKPVVKPLPLEITPKLMEQVTAAVNSSKHKFDCSVLFKYEGWFKNIELDLPAYNSVPAIDPNYEFDENLTNQILLYLTQPSNDCLWIAGDAGSGKTTGVLQVCARLKWGVQQLTCSAKSESLDLIGHTTLKNGELVFEYGALAHAMKHGEVLILNEIDTMNPNDLSAINDVLEGKPLTIIQNGGEVITPHRNFRVIATANTFGNGDTTGFYTGTRMMNQAFLDRFRFVKADYPSDTAMTRLIKAQYPKVSDDNIQKLLKFTNDIRRIISDGLANNIAQLSQPFSTRTVLKIANLLNTGLMTVSACVQTAIGARINPSEQRYMMQLVSDVWGSAEVVDDNMMEAE